MAPSEAAAVALVAAAAADEAGLCCFVVTDADGAERLVRRAVFLEAVRAVASEQPLCDNA